VDWEYFERPNDPFFNQAIAKCKKFGLYDIMGFRYDWNEEILAQFHSSLYYDARKVAFFWTTEGVKYGVDYMTFSRLLGLGSNDEKRDPIHVENLLKPSQLPALLYNPILAEAGNASTLQPYYYTMNSFFSVPLLMLRMEIPRHSATLHAISLLVPCPVGDPFASWTLFGMS
jgi:hypothetical protein